MPDALEQKLITEIGDILSDDSAFAADVQLVSYAIADNGDIKGRFKDVWRNRVFDFAIDDDGVKYKPSDAKLTTDHFDSAWDAARRFDAFSAGFLEAFDAEPIGKRTKKPQCTATNYGCGFTCIDVRRVCRIATGGASNESISPERIAKLKKLAISIREKGKKGSKEYSAYSESYAKSVDDLAGKLTDKYKKKALTETFKTGRETRQKFSSLNKAERQAKEENKIKEEESKALKKKQKEEQFKAASEKAIADMAAMRGQFKSGEEVAEFLSGFASAVSTEREKLIQTQTKAIETKARRILETQGKAKAREYYSEASVEVEKVYNDFDNTMLKMARQLLYVDKPITLKKVSIGVIDPGTGKKSGELSKRQNSTLSTGISEFQKMVGLDSINNKTIKGSVIDGKSAKAGRSFYRGGSNTLYMADNAPPAIVIHEAAHWLEESDPTVHKKVQAFFEKRTAGEKWQKLSELTGNNKYRDDEVAKPDKWPRPYAGKKTASDGNSEILSIGMESMYKDPIAFAKADPEYFAFIYNTLRGK